MAGVDVHPMLAAQGLARHEADVHTVISRAAATQGRPFAEVAASYWDWVARSWFDDFWYPMLEEYLGHAHGPWLCEVRDDEAVVAAFRMAMDGWEESREAAS